jgi:5-deoxy-glucuronate isomerase
MKAIYKAKPGDGHQNVLQFGQDGIKWLGLDVLRLAAGESWDGKLGDGEEAALVILSGKCTIAVSGKSSETFSGIGGRADIFSGPPHLVYAPRGSKLNVKAEGRLEIAFCKAPCEVDLPAKLVTPADVKVVSSGIASWRRDVRMLIPPGSPISQRLIIGETVNPPGNWSGIPPHKHDEKNKVENILEEFYYFKTKPADGFGVQLVYKGGEGVGHLVGNDDAAFLADSYHPTVAAPGVTVCYLWTLSGETKAYDITTDPRFSWIASAEPTIRELLLTK